MHKGNLVLFITVFIISGSIDVFASETDDEMEAPSMELLEFLAEFETKDGHWAGPTVLESLVDTGWSGKALEATKDE